MDDTTFSCRMQDVLDAFNNERDDFDSLMDGMTRDCSEEQWQALLHTLESERQRLETLVKDAKDRVAKLPTFRSGREEARIPGTVWLATFTDYGLVEIVDICETRSGAAEAVGADAMLKTRQSRPAARTVQWRTVWKQAVGCCPCPIIGCDHEQWTRRLRAGGDYIIQSWGTNDGKSGNDDGSDGDVRSLRTDTPDQGSETGADLGGAVVQRASPDEQA